MINPAGLPTGALDSSHRIRKYLIEILGYDQNMIMAIPSDLIKDVAIRLTIKSITRG